MGRNWTFETKIEVPITTIDQLLVNVPEISLLKIDVQGYEKSVLAETLRRTKFLLIELNYMPQYIGGSWLGEIHDILTRDQPFFLANASKPLCLNGHAFMCDGLYVNRELVRRWVKSELAFPWELEVAVGGAVLVSALAPLLALRCSGHAPDAVTHYHRQESTSSAVVVKLESCRTYCHRPY